LLTTGNFLSNWRVRIKERIEGVSAQFRVPPEWQPPASKSIIQCDESGFTVEHSFKDGSLKRIEVRWSDVKKVAAFKRDIYSYDLIGIEIESGEWVYELDEEMEGWQSMVDALPTNLPGALPMANWWTQVAFPAFELNSTALFSRE